MKLSKFLGITLNKYTTLYPASNALCKAKHESLPPENRTATFFFIRFFIFLYTNHSLKIQQHSKVFILK